MLRAMCCNSICTAAEVWCCSEHYLWISDGGFLLEAYTAVYCYHVVISEVAKTMKASSWKTWSPEGGLTRVMVCLTMARTWLHFREYWQYITHLLYERLRIPTNKEYKWRTGLFFTYRVDLCDTCTPLMHGSHTRCSQLHWLQWKGSDASTAPRMICVHHVFYRGAMTENENLWTHFVPPLFFFLWNVKMSSLPPLTVSLSGQMRELEFYTTDIRYR